jgi:hypothetical protein
VLDPVERDLAFRGKVRLRGIEDERMVETDADAVREAYRKRLDEHTEGWERAVQGEGGRMVRCCSSDKATTVVREVVRACAEARR